MKKLIITFLASVFILSACVTTNVYPGEKEGRTYESQNTRVCETLKFECGDAEIPFNDYTGCGCESAGAEISNDQFPISDEEESIEDSTDDQVDEPAEEPAEDVDETSDETPEEPTTTVECGIVNDEQIDCEEEKICGILEDETEPKCLSENVCDDLCEEGSECVIMESYPVQVRCNPIEDQMGEQIDEASLEDSESDEEEGDSTEEDEGDAEGDETKESFDDGGEETDTGEEG